MQSLYIVQVVSGGTCVGLMYKFLSSLLRIIQRFTLYCRYTCRFGTVSLTSCTALQVEYMYAHDAVHVLPWVWCKDGSYMYLGIMSYIAESLMLCMSYASLNCMSCYSLPANSPTNTHSAKRSKLMYLISIHTFSKAFKVNVSHKYR